MSSTDPLPAEQEENDQTTAPERGETLTSGYYTPKTAFLEFGSTTIKFYVLRLGGDAAGQVEREVKIPWSLGYDVFQHHRIGPTTVAHCLDTLEELQGEFPDVPFNTVTAVGTAALREAQNVELFQRLLWERLRIKIRIIEGGIEAFLLETGFRESVDTYPTGLFDLGGGSLELVEYLTPNSTRKTSVPLGAIRLHCMLRHTRDLLEYVSEGRRLAERILREQLPVEGVEYSELIGTAGTVKAIVQLLERDTFNLEDLHEILQREIHGTGWEALPLHRRRVLLPGVMVIEALFTTLGLRRVLYRTASVKRGLASLTSLMPSVDSEST